MVSITEARELITKGIYGDDNRLLISEVESDYQKELARSVLAQIPKWRVTSEDSSSISIETKSLEKGLNFCPDEKFSSLPIVSSCTAFLVAPNLILTAGHCIKDKYDCKNNYWAFDYDDSKDFSESKGIISFQKDNLVSCEQLISTSQNVKLDYALIRINREVTDRLPLKLRRSGTLDKKDSLFVIGHPMGLPKIVADKADILDNSLNYTFTTNADTYSGNSGSPVINPATHLVEGILVRGDEDFDLDSDLSCKRSFHCDFKNCKGETVQRSTTLPLRFIPKI